MSRKEKLPLIAQITPIGGGGKWNGREYIGQSVLPDNPAGMLRLFHQRQKISRAPSLACLATHQPPRVPVGRAWAVQHLQRRSIRERDDQLACDAGLRAAVEIVARGGDPDLRPDADFCPLNGRRLKPGRAGLFNGSRRGGHNLLRLRRRLYNDRGRSRSSRGCRRIHARHLLNVVRHVSPGPFAAQDAHGRPAADDSNENDEAQ